jgi:putative membrane protein
MQNGMLGALLTFSGQPLYESPLHTAALWGLTPLQDQQLAGLIMWIPSSVVHLLTLSVLFVLWLNAAERDALLDDMQRLSPRPRPSEPPFKLSVSCPRA